ncbi:ribosome biogenesis GTP-binding protein YihA/YsxC [Lutibaculum baratangense]|uniref:Probable GTP-binding protein EngB n=1 Tax=Lutibaculum baratangense AMV1 TaxID=631454 RepID=V4RNZ7_9HYPH|nr:ribosome biogenesis GTP-binding protein YihA/YsxC [Lutibaculum baratangense]ESR26979.1 GTP-binding protein EngB [Lutibaculum baratangense AMV1]
MQSAGGEDGDRDEAPQAPGHHFLFSRPAAFLRGARVIGDLPPPDLPEVAFAGRSNVGKSSLINALAGQGDLARTSNTPGRTRELNFFDLDGRLRVVDMPGYGYAKAPKAEIARWTKLIFQFLRGRVELRRVYVLIDARHGVKANDEPIFKTLDEAAVSYQAVLTKVDKLKQAEVAKVVESVGKALAKHPAAHPHVILTSSQTGQGIEELRAEMAAFALAPTDGEG